MLARRSLNTQNPPAPLQIPRIVDAGPALCAAWDAPVFVVVAPGHVGAEELRAGDLLIIDRAEPALDALVMLVPRRFGRPMLGRVTRRGVVAEPGGVPCDLDRWAVAGRLAVRVRPEARGRSRVFNFPSDADSSQQTLPLLPSSQVSGPSIHIRIEGEVAAPLARLLGQRIPGLAFVAPQNAVGVCGDAGSKAPMELAESLVTELGQRFKVGLRVAIAPTAEQAAALVERLPPGGLAVACGAPVRPSPPKIVTEQLRLW